MEFIADDKGNRLKFSFIFSSPLFFENRDGTETVYQDVSELSQTIPIEKLPVMSYDQAVAVANDVMRRRLERLVGNLVIGAAPEVS